MQKINNQHDPEMEGFLNQLNDHAPRDPETAEKGKAQFLSQAQSLAQGVSPQANRRHRGWNKILYERIKTPMKTPLKSIAWISISLFTVVAIILATNTTPVSAQQILERASEAQAKSEAAAGILHNRVRVYQNPGTVEGEGETTVSEEYYDTTTGYYRLETRDENGTVLSICSIDGDFSYYAPPTYNGSELVIERSPVENNQIDSATADGTDNKPSASSNRASVDEAMHSAFAQFYDNPRVEVEEEKTWTDGSTVYVLVNRSYQTESISDAENKSTLTGTTRMVFNKETYQLLQMETTIHQDGKDILIYKLDFLLKETLPTDTDITWNLSDLENVSFVDAEAPVER
jgi:outer membrane lipoprotein-sorting protein